MAIQARMARAGSGERSHEDYVIELAGDEEGGAAAVAANTMHEPSPTDVGLARPYFPK